MDRKRVTLITCLFIAALAITLLTAFLVFMPSLNTPTASVIEFIAFVAGFIILMVSAGCTVALAFYLKPLLQSKKPTEPKPNPENTSAGRQLPDGIPPEAEAMVVRVSREQIVDVFTSMLANPQENAVVPLIVYVSPRIPVVASNPPEKQAPLAEKAKGRKKEEPPLVSCA